MDTLLTKYLFALTKLKSIFDWRLFYDATNDLSCINKKNKSAVDEFKDHRSGHRYLWRLGPLLINPMNISNILRGERNFWVDGHRRYSLKKKVTLLGRVKTQVGDVELCCNLTANVSHHTPLSKTCTTIYIP